jgi:hypothetical protein
VVIISGADHQRERITALYQRAESAQQHTRGTQLFAEVRTAFARQTRATFGACIEVQSASDESMWERTRVAAIKDLPVVGGFYHYGSGDTKAVLYVIVERARARILTD